MKICNRVTILYDEGVTQKGYGCILDGVWSSRESVNVPKVYLSNKNQSVRGLLVNRHIGSG